MNKLLVDMTPKAFAVAMMASLGFVLTPGPALAAQPAAYMTYVAHLEPRANDGSGMYESKAIFERVRWNLLAFAREVEAAGQALDLLVSRDFILAEQAYCLEHPEETRGSNLLRMIDRLPSAEVGIHCDEADEATNYADAVEVLLSMGVPDHGIVGGTFMTPGMDASYTEFLEPQRATLSDFVWNPRIVHGLAGPNHVGDMMDSGVWRISGASPWEHDPASPLISIGGHRHSSESAAALLAEMEPGKLNALSLMVWGHTLASPNFPAGRRRVIADWQARADQVEWATLTEIATLWQTQYDGQPSLTLWGAW